MRTLEYSVKGQRLIKIGDHELLVSGTKGYLRAKFKFDHNWDDCIKVACFYNNGESYAVLLEDDECMIPKEALTNSSFEVSVEGRKKDYRILSTTVKEKQTVRRDS